MTRVAVITGGAGNFGRTLANTFHDGGWEVLATGRSQRPDTLPAAISYFSFDAAKLDKCRTFWKNIAPTDELCLVNNAGNYYNGPFLDQPDDAVENSIQGCYFTAAHMTRALMETRSSARIVNVISDGVLRPHKNNSTHGAAKAAIAHFFASLQAEDRGLNYRITNLYPGPIATEINGDDSQTNPAELARFIESIAAANNSFYVKDCTIEPVGNA